MTAINKRRERDLLEATELALQASGFSIQKQKFKHYEIEKNGKRQKIAVRTSANRWIGFVHSENGWLTLGDPNIDGFVIATYDRADQPSETVVYPVIPRATLQPHFDTALAASVEWCNTRGTNFDPRIWVCLDRRDTGRVWDAGSGIAEGFTPIARYPLGNGASSVMEEEPTAERKGQPRARVTEQTNLDAPDRGSISMVVDLDDNEHRFLAERYAQRLEVDPRRILVEVRLTFLV